MAEKPPMADLVWESTVDQGKFGVRVVREPGTEGSGGRLTVKVVETDEVLLDKRVGLSYEARFGPDVSDVSEWQQIALEAIDSFLAREKDK